MTGFEKKDNLDYQRDSEPIFSMEAILARDQRTTSHRMIPADRDENTSSTPSSIGVRFEAVEQSESLNGSLAAGHSTNGAKRSISALNVVSSDVVRHCSSSRRIRRRSSSSASSSSSSSSYSYSYRGSTLTWLRLGSLLVTLLVASINGAPTMNSKTEARLKSKTMWVNPCELNDTIGLDTDVVPLTDSQLLGQIVIQAKTAFEEAKILREKFYEKVFKVDRYEDWKSQHYDWLPSRKEIPKDLDEHLDPEFLETLDLDTALLDAYEYMQKYAVGLEQVVWDQLDKNRLLSSNFVSTEDKLRMVLCEIQVALVERQVKQRPDVGRDIMPMAYRNMSNADTNQDLRDWLIFRDYMNGLQYVYQVFGYLRDRINS